MPASTSSPIKTKVKKIHGLSIRYAGSEPRDVSAILLSPWPESLYTFEQMWPRLAGGASPRRRSRQAGRYACSPIFYRYGRAVHRAVTGAGARIGPWLTSL